MRQSRYQQIADDLRRRIQSQEFGPGASLPSEVELQRQYTASRNTVREAVKLLLEQRLLETRSGRGTYVSQQVTPFVTTLSNDPETGPGPTGEATNSPGVLQRQGQQAVVSTPEVQVLACPAQIAPRLRVEAGETVVRRRQERCLEGILWSLQTSYYPMSWVRQGAVKLLEPVGIPEGGVQHIARTLGHKQVGYRDLVTTRLPDQAEQELFGLTHHHPVLVIYRTSFTGDGTPIRVTVTVYPADRNQVAYDIGVVPDYLEEPT